MIRFPPDCPVSSKDRQAGQFVPRVVLVPLINQRAVLVAAPNSRRLELWIFNNYPNYGVYLGPPAMVIPAASGVPSDLSAAGGQIGWPLGGYEKLTITTLNGALFVASNLATGTPALVVVDLIEQ